jgi:hypothetical protein
VGSLLDTDLPENALINVRNEIAIYFRNQNGIDDKFLDGMIDEVVKDLHRRHHFTWTKKYLDTTMTTAGTLKLPSDLKKILEIRNQSFLDDENKIQYQRGTDYVLDTYNTDNPPVRVLKWTETLSADLSIRIWYYRKPTRATEESDLVDVDNDMTDIVKLGCEVRALARKGDLEEYDRMKADYEAKVINLIDDDTDPDLLETSRPYHADMSDVDFESGELT